MHSSREHERLYRATLLAVREGLVIGRGRHGVVVALSNDPHDPRFRLAVKIVCKVFTASRGKEPSFHRMVSHTLHLQVRAPPSTPSLSSLPQGGLAHAAP